MDDVEKELEERILNVGHKLKDPPTNVDELLPLLDQAEFLLSKVEQSPPQSMLAALDPAMKGLVAKVLVSNSDIDVKVAVASCISEITRITAPDAPYDDEQMKGIFEIIVEAFKGLDDFSSRSYSKRLSILETVAKVRSCVVMLDLECDALILEMFHHFFHTVRDNHLETAFSFMETIMTVVIEETEDISPELLRCLLWSVKKDNKDTSRQLGEKVIEKSAAKLKPYLLETIRSVGAPLTDYSRIVTSICQEMSGVPENNDLNASGLDDDSKLSERTVSEELPQGSAKAGNAEAVCSEEVGTAADKSLEPVTSNGTIPMVNDEALVEPYSPSSKAEQAQPDASKSTAISAAEKPDVVSRKTVKSSGQNSKKARSQKKKIPARSTETIGRSPSEIVNQALPSRDEGHSKEADDSQDGNLPDKEVKPVSVLEDKNKHSLQPSKESDEPKSISSPIITEGTPDTKRPRRGRPPGLKTSLKKEKGRSMTPDHLAHRKASVIDDAEDATLPHKDTGKSKHLDDTSDSEGKPLKSFSKKRLDKKAKDIKTSSDAHLKKEGDETSDVEAKPVKQVGRKKDLPSDSEPSKTLPVNKGRPRKGRTNAEKDVSGEETLTEAVSSPKSTTKANQDQNHSEEGVKKKSRGKRTRGAEEGSEESNEKLIGSEIKVWWPEDEKFYHGVIDSFDPATKKHKVLYADGDVEILLLKDERWEFLKPEESRDGDPSDEPGDLPNPNPSEVLTKKRVKKISDSAGKQSDMDTRMKRGTSSGKSKEDGTGSSRKRGSESVKSGAAPDAATPETGSKSKEQPASGGKLKDKSKKLKIETTEEGSQSRDELSKTEHESRDETPKSRRKPKDADLKSDSKGRNTASSSIEDKVEAPESTRDSGGPRSGPKSRGGNTPKSGSNSNANGSSVKGGKTSSKIEETGDSLVKAPDTSRKRGRTAKS